MVRLKLTVSYVGGAYEGWQLQAEGHPRSTVQKELEGALERIVGFPVRVHGSGRTDAGVHAEGQVAHVDVPAQSIAWSRALNAVLPQDIRVLDAVVVPAAFHARYDAVGKEYAYALHTGPGPVVPRLAPFVWAVPHLDIGRMEAAAALLTGRHDFASFQNAGTVVADTVRELWSIRREAGRVGPFVCPPHWPVETWFFHGSGFLKQMVRNLMGFFVWAGRGKLPPQAVTTYLDAKDRQALPSPTAPAHGLTLWRVDYGEAVTGQACPPSWDRSR